MHTHGLIPKYAASWLHIQGLFVLTQERLVLLFIKIFSLKLLGTLDSFDG